MVRRFNCKMDKLIQDWYNTVRAGWYLSLLIQNTTELGGDITLTGRYYLDHVFDCYGYFIKLGFTPVLRMNVPLTWEQFTGFDVKEARAKKRLLGVVIELLIMRKEL